MSVERITIMVSKFKCERIFRVWGYAFFVPAMSPLGLLHPLHHGDAEQFQALAKGCSAATGEG